MSLCYKEVCQILKQVVSLSIPPSYKINPETTCKDVSLQEKIHYKYHRVLMNINKNFRKEDISCVGCCEIGNLTGNEIIRLFYDIIENKPQLPRKNFICFLTCGREIGAMIYQRFRPLIVTVSPPSDSKFKYVYSKLFIDDNTNKNQRNSINDDKSELRHQAKNEYYKFLKTRFADFDLHPFGVAFFGLAADIAFHSSSKCFSKPAHELNEIPFPACIKLSFDYDLTKKVTDLFGEIGFKKEMDLTSVFDLKVECIRNAAQDIISR